MNATDWERVAERDPDHRDRMTAHDRAAAAMARDVPAEDLRARIEALPSQRLDPDGYVVVGRDAVLAILANAERAS